MASKYRQRRLMRVAKPARQKLEFLSPTSWRREGLWHLRPDEYYETMSTSTDISALYREFTDALTEVLAENATRPARPGQTGKGLAPPLKDTPTTASLDIFCRSKRPSRIGRPYKMPLGGARSGYALCEEALMMTSRQAAPWPLSDRAYRTLQ
jgi:hypothetical protein